MSLIEDSYDPMISVIVAIYQVDKYLTKCLDSIISQSYGNLQIILIDDGSNDESPAICDHYAQIDDRVEVYHKKNGGLVSARKYGIKLAKGKYVAFVDGDDYIDKDMYDELCKTMHATNADFVASGYKVIRFGQVRNVEKMGLFQHVVTNNEDRKKIIENSFFGMAKNEYISPSIWSKLYKKDFIKKCYAYVPHGQDYGEDMICLFCGLAKCQKVVSIDRAFYNYNLREGSITSIGKDTYFFNEIELYRTLYGVNRKLNNPIEDKSMFMWIREKTKDMMIMTSDLNHRMDRIQYFIQDTNKYVGKKIVIYGAGTVGKDFFIQLSNMVNCNVVGIIDKNWESIRIEGFDVSNPNLINSMKFDFVIIAMRDKKIASNIKQELIQKGIPPIKIEWERPCI